MGLGKLLCLSNIAKFEPIIHWQISFPTSVSRYSMEGELAGILIFWFFLEWHIAKY
jgi:hypothetical protein